MTYAQYRLKLSKLSRLSYKAYREGSHWIDDDRGGYLNCPNATSWAAKYFKNKKRELINAYPHYSKQYAIEALT